MLVLAIDTATPVVTAGLVHVKQPHEMVAELQRAAVPQAGPPSDTGVPPVGGAPRAWQVLAEHTVTDPFGHAEHLMPLVTAALRDAGHALEQVQAVVVGVGPGPFTGLRVGMATAAALGDGLGVAVHAVPSHDALARRAADGGVAGDLSPGDRDTAGGAGEFLVVTDARRREVYLSAYRRTAGGPVHRLHGPCVLAPAAVPPMVVDQGFSPGWITGTGGHLLAGALDLPMREPRGPLVGYLVDCALQPLLTGVVPGPLSPLYLRRPDAAEPAAPKPVLPAGAPAMSTREGADR